MTASRILFVSFLSIMLSACACGKRPMVTPFSESEFLPYSKAGTGAVTGKLLTAAGAGIGGCDIVLNPLTAYNAERFYRMTVDGVRLDPADPRMKQFGRHTVTNKDGFFRVDQLPPGRYAVGTAIFWDVPGGPQTKECGVAYGTALVEDGKTTEAPIIKSR